MMYNWDEKYISVQVKNLQTKKFYKSVVSYEINNKERTKRAIEELKEQCESLLERLSIIDGCIVFMNEPRKSGKYFL